MIESELPTMIEADLGHPPTPEQRSAIRMFTRFLTHRSEKSAMILRGSAGTGKSTLAGAIVKSLLRLNQKLVLMAPTGRAAKVLCGYANHAAFTIHRRIYRQRSAADLSVFNLNDNLYNHALFVVDEASMIPNAGIGEHTFGSGRLLEDLISYVYSGTGCRLLLIGDKAQLPPVGETESCALSRSVLEGYGLEVFESDLNKVLRQSQSSGILYNATLIRQLITHDEATQLPVIHFRGFADIQPVRGDELIEALSTSYHQVGTDETIVLTRSNKRANIYNQGIRNMVLFCEEELSRGDQLMIVKNNYYWVEKNESKSLNFLANGDRCVVQRLRNVHQQYGFRFADATLLFPDYDNLELQATVLLDTLSSESSALNREQQEQLYNKVMDDYADIRLKSERLKQLRQDRYYNAIQVKFAYAVTCHKAQGGQWAHVYIDQGYMTADMLTPDHIHWLYTAFTRATEKLFLVNWPEAQSEK